MFCTSCGREIKDEEKSCIECDQAVLDDSETLETRREIFGTQVIKKIFKFSLWAGLALFGIWLIVALGPLWVIAIILFFIFLTLVSK